MFFVIRIMTSICSETLPLIDTIFSDRITDLFWASSYLYSKQYHLDLSAQYWHSISRKQPAAPPTSPVVRPRRSPCRPMFAIIVLDGLSSLNDGILWPAALRQTKNYKCCHPAGVQCYSKQLPSVHSETDLPIQHPSSQGRGRCRGRESRLVVSHMQRARSWCHHTLCRHIDPQEGSSVGHWKTVNCGFFCGESLVPYIRRPENIRIWYVLIQTIVVCHTPRIDLSCDIDWTPWPACALWEAGDCNISVFD